jgi:hypothetical protein
MSNILIIALETFCIVAGFAFMLEAIDGKIIWGVALGVCLVFVGVSI